MEKRLRNQLWRIPLLVTAVFAVVYSIIFLSLGYMPSAERGIIFNKEAYIFGNFLMEYQPQLGISRWWDLVIIFIATLVSVKIFHCFEKVLEKLSDETWKAVKEMLNILILFFILLGFLMMWCDKKFAIGDEEVLTITFFIFSGLYLTLFTIMEIVRRVLKSKPVVTLLNWAMDRKLV